MLVLTGAWVMDADLSHPPECIVELLSGLDADCDMVVGSRYASGGVVDSNWSRRRLLTSRLGIWLARPLGSAVRSAIGTRSPSRRRSLSPACTTWSRRRSPRKLSDMGRNFDVTERGDAARAMSRAALRVWGRV